MERLDKILASQGAGSRKEVQRIIRSGEVAVNGEICTKPEAKADAQSDVITVGGQALNYSKNIYIMMNKPAGVVSATKDKHDKTVIDILPEQFRRKGLFPAGRLDKDTEGLLIITDDGELAHRMLSPSKHVEKRYIARLDGEITDETIEEFKNGIEFANGEKCRPAELEIYGGDKKTGLVTICEGKFHQVKKMFIVCGLKVMHLQRISIGNLYLDSNLPIGASKILSNLDIKQIFLGKIH